MDALLNPNVAYVLLVLGFILAILAMLSPGTGLLELGAMFILVIAGYIISTLAFNWWAVLLFLPALALLWIAVRSKEPQRVWPTIAAALVLFVAGSAFLFDLVDGQLAIHPLLIVFLPLLVTVFTWWLGRKTLEAIHSRRAFDLDRITGMIGRATTDIHRQGTVYVNGESWTATSHTFIPSGSAVRVIRRNGLLLEVEPVPPQDPGS